MIERVIIHAGTMKTGTTAIQQYMLDHRDRHAALGTFYPLPPAGRINHVQLQSALLKGQPGDIALAIREGIDAAPEGTKTVFFSYEGVYDTWLRMPSPNRNALGELALQIPIEIWVYFRDPLDHMISLHNQDARRARVGPGQTAGLSLEERLQEPRFVANCNYRGFIRKVMKFVPAAQIRIGAYAPAAVQEIVTALGLPFDGEEPRVNASVSVAALEAIDAIRKADMTQAERDAEASNVIGKDMGGDTRIALSAAVLAFAAELRAEHGNMMAVSGQRLRDCWSAVAAHRAERD